MCKSKHYLFLLLLALHEKVVPPSPQWDVTVTTVTSKNTEIGPLNSLCSCSSGGGAEPCGGGSPHHPNGCGHCQGWLQGPRCPGQYSGQGRPANHGLPHYFVSSFSQSFSRLLLATNQLQSMLCISTQINCHLNAIFYPPKKNNLLYRLRSNNKNLNWF